MRINNISALVQIMAWRQPGDEPLSEPMIVSILTHICVTRPQWVKKPLLEPILTKTHDLGYLDLVCKTDGFVIWFLIVDVCPTDSRTTSGWWTLVQKTSVCCCQLNRTPSSSMSSRVQVSLQDFKLMWAQLSVKARLLANGRAAFNESKTFSQWEHSFQWKQNI